MPYIRRATIALVLTAAACAAGAPAASAQTPGLCPQLQLAANWKPLAAARIQATIDAAGTCKGTPAQTKPFAVFDWDNTLMKNDISDQTIYWLLRNGKILQPPGKDWSRTSRFISRAGARALSRACDDLADAGEPLPTGRNTRASKRCADEILSFRKTEETTGGDDAFDQANARRMQPMYAWVGQLTAGYRPDEVREFAAIARRAALRAPVGATWRVGSTTQTAWTRYYPEMRDLVATLKAAGIEPWIVSASPKTFADVWGGGLGIDREHTIGIRQLLDRRGRLTTHLEGCAWIPDGRDTVITYIDGKRCFINKDILGIGKDALKQAPADRRQVLAAGDATTDVTMVADAVGVHVAINRNQPELMCRGYADQDGRWAVQPMFIEPLPQLTTPYPCSTTGATNAKGEKIPVIGDDGQPIPDQADTIF